jgi:hypothetical protein
MDIAELVLRYLQVLVWPATILIALLIFRTQISEFIHNLRRIQGPGGFLLKLIPGLQLTF